MALSALFRKCAEPTHQPVRFAVKFFVRHQGTPWSRFSKSQNGWTWQRSCRRTRTDAQEIDLAEVARSPKLARLEAALFVADGALSAKKLVQVATLENVAEAHELMELLNASYDAENAAFRVERVAAGYQLLTRPHLAPWLDRLHNRHASLKLSPPAMETLAIIAYRQPCTRADVEAVRGVQAAEMIKQLLERNLIRVAGEDDSLGRPYLYGTTRLFLESFGVTSLDDLPMADVLRQKEEPAVTTDDHAESISPE